MLHHEFGESPSGTGLLVPVEKPALGQAVAWANQADGLNELASPEQIRLALIARDIFLAGFGPNDYHGESGIDAYKRVCRVNQEEGVEQLAAGFRLLRHMMGETTYRGLHIQGSSSTEREPRKPYLYQIKNKVLVCSKYQTNHDEKLHFMGGALATGELATVLAFGAGLALERITDEEVLRSIVIAIDNATYYVNNMWWDNEKADQNAGFLAEKIQTIYEKAGAVFSEREARATANRQVRAIADWRVSAEQMALAA